MDDYTCFLSSPFSSVIVFIALHFSHFAPKSDLFQKAWGVEFEPHELYKGIPYHFGIICVGISHTFYDILQQTV